MCPGMKSRKDCGGRCRLCRCRTNHRASGQRTINCIGHSDGLRSLSELQNPCPGSGICFVSSRHDVDAYVELIQHVNTCAPEVKDTKCNVMGSKGHPWPLFRPAQNSWALLQDSRPGPPPPPSSPKQLSLSFSTAARPPPPNHELLLTNRSN